jgi:hypothetical protein
MSRKAWQKSIVFGAGLTYLELNVNQDFYGLLEG